MELQVALLSAFVFSATGDGPAMLWVPFEPGVGQERLEVDARGQLREDFAEVGPSSTQFSLQLAPSDISIAPQRPAAGPPMTGVVQAVRHPSRRGSWT